MTSSAPVLHHSIASIRADMDTRRATGQRVVLVPTMGALHEGHIELVRQARALGDVVVVSIFVNPLQFGAGEDLDCYPRTRQRDLDLLAGLADCVFVPSVQEMYPDNAPGTLVAAGALGSLYEGAVRPGHFDGVLTVVAKLIGIVQPHSVVFGQKDAQQVFLVRRMVRDLDMRVSVETFPIVREAGGLALSSRNRYLTGQQREAAVTLSTALRSARDFADQGTAAVRQAAQKRVNARPEVRLDYLVVVDPATFLPVDDDYQGHAMVLIAALVGTTRLIDNEQIVIE